MNFETNEIRDGFIIGAILIIIYIIMIMWSRWSVKRHIHDPDWQELALCARFALARAIKERLQIKVSEIGHIDVLPGSNGAIKCTLVLPGEVTAQTGFARIEGEYTGTVAGGDIYLRCEKPKSETAGRSVLSFPFLFVRTPWGEAKRAFATALEQLQQEAPALATSSDPNDRALASKLANLQPAAISPKSVHFVNESPHGVTCLFRHPQDRDRPLAVGTVRTRSDGKTVVVVDYYRDMSGTVLAHDALVTI